MKKLASYTFACLLLLPANWLSVLAQSPTLHNKANHAASTPRLAPDLEDILAQDDEDERQALTGKTLAEVRQERRLRASKNSQLRNEETAESRTQRTRVAGVLLPSLDVLAEEKQSFIVQVGGSVPSPVLREKVAQVGGTVRHINPQTGLLTIAVPRHAIRQIAADPSVAYVSPDRPVVASGHLEATTGAAQIRNLINTKTLDGTGVGIAVIDSGVDGDHIALNPSLSYAYYEYYYSPSTFQMWWDATNYDASVVKLSKSFLTNNTSSEDYYGHGTHVASLIGGQANFFDGHYKGVAPKANLLNLRVLDSNGAGSASAVVAAIDWCVTNKAAYNIRVINLSLGSMAKDSYRNDPLCLAARRAANAGIVVVAAAGNDGKSSNGRKIYGGIHAPGIDPSVITVGAVNTFGTDVRSDDVVASYSSRGPTRGYSVVNGGRKYDNLIKPDLIAPGNKLIAAQSFGDPYSRISNKLVTDYPALNYINNPNGTYQGVSRTFAKMQLSGTSMSAPVVSGAVALMLQANPSLTPNLVKAILMYTAQPLNGFSMLEQGAGALNVDGAVRMAQLVKTTLPITNGGALLTSTTMPTQQSTIAGQTFNWSRGVITNFGFLYGNALMQSWQSVYGNGLILGDATTYGNNVLSLVAGKTYNASLKSGAVQITGNGQILSDSLNTLVASGQVLADGQIISDGQILGDGIIISDGLILGDGTTRADTSLQPNSSVWGDNTAAMPIAPARR